MTKPSHPRLDAEGWNEKEPTEVLDLALERVKKGTAAAEKSLRISRERLTQTSREFHVDLEAALRACVNSEPPPAPPR